MRFVTARELRNRSSQLWEDLAREKELVVTVNGKPVALITDIGQSDLEETLRVLRRTRAQTALSRARRASVVAGRDQLTSAEIENEIKAVRRGRKR